MKLLFVGLGLAAGFVAGEHVVDELRVRVAHHVVALTALT